MCDKIVNYVTQSYQILPKKIFDGGKLRYMMREQASEVHSIASVHCSAILL